MTDPAERSDREGGEARRTLEAARARGAEALPCPGCGSTARPLIRKPQRLSAEWWDDPSAYIGCADCGYYLADIPDTSPVIWSSEVAEDSEDDPEGSVVNPREFD